MTENSSGFENLIKEMNNSQNSIDKVKIWHCQNPNCKTAFAKYEKCLCCNKTYCSTCLNQCDNCSVICCKFCTRIVYSKFRDFQICPNCVN